MFYLVLKQLNSFYENKIVRQDYKRLVFLGHEIFLSATVVIVARVIQELCDHKKDL